VPYPCDDRCSDGRCLNSLQTNASYLYLVAHDHIEGWLPFGCADAPAGSSGKLGPRLARHRHLFARISIRSSVSGVKRLWRRYLQVIAARFRTECLPLVSCLYHGLLLNVSTYMKGWYILAASQQSSVV
jgi:hypothetical protein